MLSSSSSRRPGRQLGRLVFDDAIDDGGERAEGRGERLDVGRDQAVRHRFGDGRRHRGEDLADGHLQRAREADEHVRARFRLRELDAADVLVVETGRFRQFFLRQILAEPQLTDLRTQGAQDRRPLVRLSGWLSACHTPLCTATARALEPPIVVMFLS
jgi:hypothetical protein